MMKMARRVGYLVVAVISAATVVAAGYTYLKVDDFRDNVTTTPALDEIPNSPPEDDGAEDILLVGSDSRTDAKGKPLSREMLAKLRTTASVGVNTDTLIIVRFPHDGGPPRAVSLPRDSWVRVPTGGKAKINSAYGVAKAAEAARLHQRGGMSAEEIERASDERGRRALIQTVQDFTKVHIDHYAEVSLLGFYLLTEALGGVEVCLNAATSDADSGANFRAGRQTISGSEALAYVRQRKNLPRGDLDRIVRQQTFLASALHKVLSTDTLTDNRKLRRLVNAVERSVVLDPDLDILEFAQKARSLSSRQVTFVTIPVENINGRSPDGKQSIVVVDEKKVRAFVRDLIRPKGNPAGTSSGPSAPGASSSQAPRGGGSSPGAALGVLTAQEGEPISGGRAPCVN
ncbi:LCP family protein [Thermocrispum sp.]|jgi:LCP family protein required for cell wall assembly|uniref:LCP family protein n=1 Tax=Thermocrispum sp. TaxID=2060768 RepID=UPI00257C201A|nr:LCP family protein [Thermocrispum sp.]